MKTRLCLPAFTVLLAFPLALPLRAQTSSKPQSSNNGITTTAAQLEQQLKAAKKPTSDKWRFSFLPIGAQRNPQIDYTIITEMTTAGRKLPEPSFDKPVYYISSSQGQRDVGDPYGGTKEIPYKALEKQLNTALASNGYRPSDESHPPTQIFFFVWGMHNRIDPLTDATTDTGDGSSDTGGGDVSVGVDSNDIMNLLSRAKTIGGQKFADEFATALADQLQWSGNTDYESNGPLRNFATKNDTNEALVYEIFNDCYYLIVLSLDYDALKGNERKLLWSTHISTTSRGVSFEQTLPIMINNGAYYFGRPSDGIEIIRKNAYKNATVEIGEAQVVEYMTTGTTGAAKPATTGTTKPPAGGAK